MFRLDQLPRSSIFAPLGSPRDPRRRGSRADNNPQHRSPPHHRLHPFRTGHHKSCWRNSDPAHNRWPNDNSHARNRRKGRGERQDILNRYGSQAGTRPLHKSVPPHRCRRCGSPARNSDPDKSSPKPHSRCLPSKARNARNPDRKHLHHRGGLHCRWNDTQSRRRCYQNHNPHSAHRWSIDGRCRHPGRARYKSAAPANNGHPGTRTDHPCSF